jgi:ribosome-associated toxin RatA of RatAB toxin-antitoxin module
VGAISREIRIRASIGRVWEVIADYASYPGFVPGIRACRVVGGDATLRHVEYEVDLGLRRIGYILAHLEDPPHRVSWSLVSGDLLERSNGAWELSDAGGVTLARYTVEVRIARPPFVPQLVVDGILEELTRAKLPLMLEAFKARAEGPA